MISCDLPPFTVTDELYHNLDITPQATVLLEARGPADGALHPLMVAHQHGAGRSVYDALGHDTSSLSEPTHARIVTRAAAWALGFPDHRVAEI